MATICAKPSSRVVATRCCWSRRRRGWSRYQGKRLVSLCLSSLANWAPGTARKPVAPINVRLHPGGHLCWWSRAHAHRLRPGLKERRLPDTGTAARRPTQRRRGTRPDLPGSRLRAGMTNAIENLAMGGHRVAISDEALAGLSPYQTDHINRFGDYVLDLSTPPAPLPFMLPTRRQPPSQRTKTPSAVPV